MHRSWKTFLALVGSVFLTTGGLHAQAAGSSLVRKEWNVGGVPREALVCLPSNVPARGVPLLFDFHGHGGTMRNASRADYHGLWPEAIVIYPQGLPSSGHLVDKEGRLPGWQFSEGEQGDRDLKFFDAMLATAVNEYRADPKNVFVAGHSNGGRFSQLLWAARGDKLKAVAASGTSALNLVLELKPKPYLQISGKNDPLVPVRLQKASFNALLKINGGGPGRMEKQYPDGTLTRYSSSSNIPTLFFLHPGDHSLPAEVPRIVAAFFRECSAP